MQIRDNKGKVNSNIVITCLAFKDSIPIIRTCLAMRLNNSFMFLKIENYF